MSSSYRKRHLALVTLVVATLATLGIADAQAPTAKPPVPAGKPVQGLAVLMLTTGIDYTRPSVARKLARDGEGDLIGWDGVDKDGRPYGTDPEQSRLIEIAPSFVIPVRIDPKDAASIVEALAFARRTTSRTLVVPVSLFDAPQPPEVAAYITETDVLLIVAGADAAVPKHLPAGARDRTIVVGALPPVPAAASNPTNVDVILLPPAAAREAPGDAMRAPRTAAEAAILFVAQLACRRHELSAAKDARDAKRLLLAAAKKEPNQSAPLLEDCTRSLAR